MRLLLAALLATTCLLADTTETLAGTGVSGASGDGGPATAAQVGNPYGLTLGPDGALYVCEVDTERVRRIDMADGTISTVAGTGEVGYSGDGGPARDARLNDPYEIRFDEAGNMYFVEMLNAIVRLVDADTGTISTVAGTGQRGFSGDGGPAVRATLNRPHSIALDGQGSLYIADIGNHRIRRVDLATGIVTTFAGTGEREPTPDGAPLEGTPLNGPRALAFAPSGDMYIALREGNAVYRLDMRAKRLHHVAGTGEKGYTGDGGPAKLSTLAGPKGIEVGPDSAIYLADTENHAIRRIDTAAGTISTIAGDGSRHDGPDGDPLGCGLARPHGVYVDSAGNVYIGDSENHRVRVVRP
jgi:streptogramin lyase